MSDKTPKQLLCEAMRDAIATLERASRHFWTGSQEHQGGWQFDPTSCKNIASSIDLMLDTYLMLMEIIRELGAAESEWVAAIDEHQAKIDGLTARVAQMRRVLELGILSKN